MLSSMKTVVIVFTSSVLCFGVLLVVGVLLLRQRIHSGLKERSLRSRMTIGFLHPFCNDGGGGERVLWCAIRELLSEKCDLRVVVYTGDAASDEEIRAHALSRFGVAVPSEVVFVRLSLRGWIEPKRYPIATLIGQALGSMLLAAEAVARCPPHTLVDTTGLHFSLPLLRLLGVPKLACYVHYPIISSDMVGAVASRQAAHNNARRFVGRLAVLKLAYYRALVRLYALAGRQSDATMANGSWTANHLRQLWGVEPSLVYPPCDTRQLQALPLEPAAAVGTYESGADSARRGPHGSDRRDESMSMPDHSMMRRGQRRLVLSVAQFRPEKDHAKQLHAFASLLRRWQGMPAADRGPRPTLVVAGAVRHAADSARLDELHELAASLFGEFGGAGDYCTNAQLGSTSPSCSCAPSSSSAASSTSVSVSPAVCFAPNLSLPELRALFGSAAIGLHTMWNEHFGIGVVEMCAAGIAVIAHNSGGPAMDIVRDGETGRLADTAEEYAEAMASLLLGPAAEAKRAAMAKAGREAVATRFSEDTFAQEWTKALDPLLSA